MMSIQSSTEKQAKEIRQGYINLGRSVSLIGYNTEDEVYEFDVLD